VIRSGRQEGGGGVQNVCFATTSLMDDLLRNPRSHIPNASTDY